MPRTAHHNKERKNMKAKAKLKIRQAKREQFVQDYARYFLATGIAFDAGRSKKIIKQFYS
jgi:CRISPR/Cas system CSM-associated protein Csm4 (group 5 of RAMP superfamily)